MVVLRPPALTPAPAPGPALGATWAPDRGAVPPTARPAPVGRARTRAVAQAASSASTLAAWPSAFTWYQARTILPSAPTRNVDRITPIDFLP